MFYEPETKLENTTEKSKKRNPIITVIVIVILFALAFWIREEIRKDEYDYPLGTDTVLHHTTLMTNEQLYPIKFDDLANLREYKRGEYCIIITYKITNNSDTDISPNEIYNYNVYQEGVSCPDITCEDGSPDDGERKLKPGASLEFKRKFKLHKQYGKIDAEILENKYGLVCHGESWDFTSGN